MNALEAWDRFWQVAVSLVWGMPLVVLLISAGIYFAIAARLLPLRHLRHAVDLVRGRYDDPAAPGEIRHFDPEQAAWVARRAA